MRKHYLKNFINNNINFLKLQKKFIGYGAFYQKESNKVKIRGKFLKSRNHDMPTLLFFPDVLEPAENFEKWFMNPLNKTLEYRNVWLLNPRNFGDSDHHDSYEMEDVCHDINRFINEKKLTYVTVAGHGYGAKIACAFGSLFHERVSGVACFEGGPIDNSYHEAWEEVRNLINYCSKIPTENASVTDIIRKIDIGQFDPTWKKIMKQNVIEGKGGFQWKFNMSKLVENVNKMNRCHLSKWNESYGIILYNFLLYLFIYY
jgi:pimeloyl-ACP methyl ester carboxylesterase